MKVQHSLYSDFLNYSEFHVQIDNWLDKNDNKIKLSKNITKNLFQNERNTFPAERGVRLRHVGLYWHDISHILGNCWNR